MRNRKLHGIDIVCVGGRGGRGGGGGGTGTLARWDIIRLNIEED